MTRYPLSHNAGKNLGEYFYDILTFHIPPSKDRRILDPTCGKRHLWAEFMKPTLHNKTRLDEYGDVVFSDVVDYGYNTVSSFADLEFNYQFDGIIFDPPYFFGYEGSDDPRKEDYGGYIQTYDDLVWFMDTANAKFPEMLQADGKLILKCADQYQTRERKFYPHHHEWIDRLTYFKIVDLNVFIHHRLSPTAFQVKDRPCSVIMHTYFLTFKKRG
jgi:hypothetical protein